MQQQDPPPAEKRTRRANRARVTRACDRCKKRKTRCTGLQPCRLCDEAAATCTYNAAYLRGRLLPVTSSRPASGTPGHFRSEEQAIEYATGSINDIVQGASPTLGLLQENAVGEHSDSFIDVLPITHPSKNSAPEPVSRASPEPTQTDLEGHYVGPSSGVSFLLRVQKRLDESVSFPQGSSIFNFGDAPLPYFAASGAFSLMLDKANTARLVGRFFDFAVPVDRFLHRPTTEKLLEEFHNTMGSMLNRDEAPARTAVLFMVFAIAQEHMEAQPTSVCSDMRRSIRYFMAASQQLSKEQGTVRLESIQARLLQCLWLLSLSRINHCWSLFGTVARLAFAIGLHRGRVADSLDHIQLECRRRTFWSAYSLDNYLSTALGRPRTFHEDDIDQELPASIDDDDLQANGVVSRSSRGQSVMLGQVAYSKLSKIQSGILHDVYSIRPTSLTAKFTHTARYTTELKAWRSDMSRFLDLDLNAAPLVLIFQRQRNVLNLAYWHNMILTHRPHLLSNFARLKNRSRRGRVQNDSHRAQTEASVQECLQAAMNIVRTVDDIIQAGQLHRAFWFTPYFAFSASVILYVYTIQNSNKPDQTYRPHYDAAERCQGQIANIAKPGSLTSRYCLILEELRSEATRQMNNPQNQARDANQNLAALEDVMASSAGANGHDEAFLSQRTVAEMQDSEGFPDFNVSPSDSLEDLTGWGQFDSMVWAAQYIHLYWLT
ncbi:fungal specific transcription factor domain-containing protein [Colletotrichum truncatum]|uniref:Fungal specific transcription factor domain-containing protein n=1 Tax=Colletotrichum truncatum TaxID=5467 RepID=A0ACC3YYM7_COLTU